MNPLCSLQTNPLFVLFLEPQEFSNQDVCSRLSYLMEGGHTKQCFAGCKRTLPNATQPIGKVYQFIKKANSTFDPMH